MIFIIFHLLLSFVHYHQLQTFDILKTFYICQSSNSWFNPLQISVQFLLQFMFSFSWNLNFYRIENKKLLLFFYKACPLEIFSFSLLVFLKLCSYDGNMFHIWKKKPYLKSYKKKPNPKSIQIWYFSECRVFEKTINFWVTFLIP